MAPDQAAMHLEQGARGMAVGGNAVLKLRRQFCRARPIKNLLSLLPIKRIRWNVIMETVQ